MKNKIRKLNTALLFILFIMMSSCNGQTVSTVTSNNRKTTIAGQAKINLPAGVSPQTMFRCSMKDNDGNLWFGTTGAGIYKYDGKLFSRYSENEGLTSNFVVGIAQDIKGNIWAATDNGIFHNKGNRFTRIEIPELAGTKFGIDNNNSSIKKLQGFVYLATKKGIYGLEQKVMDYGSMMELNSPILNVPIVIG
jgi:ligand-binding sensor domain-containing protein